MIVPLRGGKNCKKKFHILVDKWLLGGNQVYQNWKIDYNNSLVVRWTRSCLDYGWIQAGVIEKGTILLFKMQYSSGTRLYFVTQPTKLEDWMQNDQPKY